MKTDSNYKFTLNVSNEGYEKKTDATACLSSKGAEAINRKKMCFFEQNITVDEFLVKAQSGYSFCALYRFEDGKKYWYTNKAGQHFLGYPHYQRNSKTATEGGLKIDFKRDEYFSGSQVIFIDIDFTNYTDINDYINSLTFKPTMVYMSYSDGKEKNGIISRRFHLCYVFDDILTSEQFKTASITLSDSLVIDTNEELEDKCGEKMSQYMNGCFGNSENYTTYTIYNYNDIEIYNINREEVEVDNIEYRTTTLNTKMENDTIEEEEPIKDEITFDERLLNDWDRLDVEEFKKLPSWIRLLQTTKHYYRVEKEYWINDKYQVIDDDYFRLFYNRTTVKDGNGRRKDLFMRMCLRRVINPNIKPEELVFNAILDIIRQYDNSDKVLNSDFIKRNVVSALELTIDEIKEEYDGEIKYLQKSNPKKGIIYRNRKVHTKETTYQILDEYYDNDLSVQENIDMMNDIYNFPIGKSTIYEYLKIRGFKTEQTKLSDDDILGMLDFSISAIDNYTYIKSLGYKIGNKRINKIYKEYKKIIEEDKTTTLNIKMENDTININANIKSINYDLSVA